MPSIVLYMYLAKNESSKLFTEMCKKYLVRVKFYYVFHLKSRFFLEGGGVLNVLKSISCQILIKICTRKAKMYVVFYRFFQIMFWSMVFKYFELVG